VKGRQLHTIQFVCNAPANVILVVSYMLNVPTPVAEFFELVPESLVREGLSLWTDKKRLSTTLWLMG
jgi:hypothetical protein